MSFKPLMSFRINPHPVACDSRSHLRSLWIVAQWVVEMHGRFLGLASRLVLVAAVLVTVLGGKPVQAGFLAVPEVGVGTAQHPCLNSAMSLFVGSVVEIEGAGAGAVEEPLDLEQVSEKVPSGPSPGIPVGLGFSSFVALSTSGRSSAGSPEPTAGSSGNGSFACCQIGDPFRVSLWVTMLFSADRAVLPLVPPPDVFRPPPIAVWQFA